MASGTSLGDVVVDTAIVSPITPCHPLPLSLYNPLLPPPRILVALICESADPNKEARPMKVYIVVDMEGISGIVNQQQVSLGEPEF
ncbi:MAG: M55 family metallopeptidase [Chloroflexota bacterium]|nr:M55 family metallopeptidase [Chloroflexota bacterium]